MKKKDMPKNVKAILHSTTGRIVLENLRFRLALKGEKAYWHKLIEEHKKPKGDN